jgi:hypothetical protein
VATVIRGTPTFINQVLSGCPSALCALSSRSCFSCRSRFISCTICRNLCGSCSSAASAHSLVRRSLTSPCIYLLASGETLLPFTRLSPAPQAVRFPTFNLEQFIEAKVPDRIIRRPILFRFEDVFTFPDVTGKFSLYMNLF